MLDLIKRNAILELRIRRLERELKEKDETIKVLGDEVNHLYEKLWKAENNHER